MSAKITTIDLKDTAVQRKKMKTRAQERPIPAEDTILLLPHCLRVSSTCRAAAGEDGLVCVECNPACQVNLLRKAALEAGFSGVCVAPGGSLALKYVKKTRPLAIVAVACENELNEGVANVSELFGSGNQAPDITIIPLVREGCIDTRVDIKKAVAEILSKENREEKRYCGAGLKTGSTRR